MASKVRIVGLDGSHEVENVCSVLDALSAAGLSTEVTVRVNGQAATADTELQDNDTIAVSPPEVKQG